MGKQQHDSSSRSSDTADAATHLQKRLRSLPTFARELIAGGLAGGLAKTAVAPLERTKIIFQTRGGALTVQGVLQYIWQHEGFVGLFKGNTASVLRIVPYAAIHFGLYEYFRRGIVQLAVPHSRPGSREHGIPLWDLLAGSASGASAVLATYPLDLVRTRLAYATEAPPPSTQPGGVRIRHRHPGIFSLLVTTAKDEGMLGLYRGVLPTLLGILPYAGLKFYVYQAMKNHYRATSSSSTDSQVVQQQQQRQQAVPAANDSGVVGSDNVVVAQAADCSLALAAANTLLSNGSTQQQPELSVATQQQPQQLSDESLQQQQQQQQQPQKLPVMATLVFGGVAGLVAQTVTYPLDVIRRQLQVAHLNRSASIKELKLQLNSNGSSSNGSTTSAAVAAGAAGSNSSGSSSGTAGGLHSGQAALHSSRSANFSGSSSSSTWQRSSAALAAAAAAASPQAAASSSSSSSSWSGAANPNSTAAAGYRRQVSHHAAQCSSMQGMHSMHSAHSILHPEPSMVAVTRNLVAQGGLRALFRGLSINYMKVVPSTAIGFTVYDALKSYLGLTSSL